MAVSHSSVPLGRSNWRRDFGGAVNLPLLNRFFENDASSTEDPNALLARPGTTHYRGFGDGPIRALFQQDGVFDGDWFIVSGNDLIRHDPDGSDITISTNISDASKFSSITYQASPGVERLWIADGQTLWYYEGESKSRGTLSLTGAISDMDVVEIGGMYYQWTSGSVDAGTPDGSMSDPWLLSLGASDIDSLARLSLAIDGAGTPGSEYSTALVPHPDVETRRLDETNATLTVQARVPGASEDTITTTETSAGLSWGAGTLLNGGLHFLDDAVIPEGATGDDVFVPLELATLAAYVIIVTAGSQRMFFIRPGEFWVELFAEAEAEPDELLGVKVVGDQFWALGRSTIEPWAPTGDSELPFAPIAGRAQRYGIVPGTAAVINNDIMYVDQGGVVRNTAGERLSDHSVEESIRKVRVNG